MFKKRVPRRIFVSKREEVRADWENFHNEEFHNL
jgi:hypothetical protein